MWNAEKKGMGFRFQVSEGRGQMKEVRGNMNSKGGQKKVGEEGKMEKKEVGKMRRWGKSKTGDGETGRGQMPGVEKSGDLGMGSLEGGMGKAEGTDTPFIIPDITIGPQSNDFASL